MAKTPRETIKTWFETGDFPTQEQFWNWLDSFWHQDDVIPVSSVEDFQDLLDAKADIGDYPRAGTETLNQGSNDVVFTNAIGTVDYHLVIDEVNGKAVDKANLVKAGDKFTIEALEDNTIISYVAVKTF